MQLDLSLIFERLDKTMEGVQYMDMSIDSCSRCVAFIAKFDSLDYELAVNVAMHQLEEDLNNIDALVIHLKECYNDMMGVK